MKIADDTPTETNGEVTRLREENARLRALLARHGIETEDATQPSAGTEAPPAKSGRLSADDKVRLFRRLFIGREDVFARRYESKSGRAGYTPACANEWRSGVCRKPRVKCAQCEHRQFLEVTDRVIYDHLLGKHTVGVYPLLPDDTCRFLAVDFDGEQWKDDVVAFSHSCTEADVPVAIEISRSGDGAHVWLFFSEAVPAYEARQLGSALISDTCERTRQLSLNSYDRLLPNQDTAPKGGFGNLIALPLQRAPRSKGHSVFVDTTLTPFEDQWEFLSSLRALSARELSEVLERLTGVGHPVDVPTAEHDYDDEAVAAEPWRHRYVAPRTLAGPLPEALSVVLADRLYIEHARLPQPLVNRILRLAAFQNPEFYRAQKLRLSVWNKPRIIFCSEMLPRHLVLPRGCLLSLMELCNSHDIHLEIRDQRPAEQAIECTFLGTLREDQVTARDAMLRHEIGVLNAPTAFGKTVTAAAVIAMRRVTTLVLVHRVELLHQWKERLHAFLELNGAPIGTIGDGKLTPGGAVDVAVLQSLIKRDDVAELLDRYSQIIIDECHHIPAFSFESVVKKVNCRYVLGLSATPVRRDGHHPIVFMQCGPIRHSAASTLKISRRLTVHPRTFPVSDLPNETTVQSVFRTLAESEARNRAITEDAIAAYRSGRKVLLLTERTGHVTTLHNLISGELPNCFALHGQLSKKRRRTSMSEIEALDVAEPRIIIATGRLIGEGFDHAPLDTLILAMPVSWRGTLQQYAGRLHRDCAWKGNVEIIDYVDRGHPLLERMWNKRVRGYRSMGYEIVE